MSDRKKAPKTFAELARCLSVSTRTIENWREYSDWPARNKDGSFNLRAIEAFCKRHCLGQYNPSRGEKSRYRRDKQREATIQLTIERSEVERIKKERLLVVQQEELAGIVLNSDVQRLYGETKEVVATVLSQVVVAVDEAMPATKKRDKDWASLRKNVMSIVGGLSGEVAAAMQELAKK